jgi:hypothetical protein
MAIYFNNQPQSRSALLGQSFGTGLSQGIQQLAQNKLDNLNKQLQSRQTSNALLQYYPELGQEGANALSQLPPELQKIAYKGLEEQRFMKSQQQGAMGGGGVNPMLGENEGPDYGEQFLKSVGPARNPEQLAKNQAKAAEFSIKGQQKNLELNEKRQEKIRPYVLKRTEQFENQRKASNLAKEMLANIEKNKSKWPGAIKGNLPSWAQSVLIRDPDLRTYSANANELVTLMAGTRKGLPTNFKLKMEQLAKSDFSQPIETQEEILKKIVALGDEESTVNQYIDSLSDQYGNYPVKLPSLVAKFENALDNPLKNPDFYEEGTVVEENNKQYVLKNGKWKAA